MEHRLVFLTPGQQAPIGSMGVMINNGIVWIGEEGTFPSEALLGLILITDPTPVLTYNSRLMTEEEIYEYENPEPVDPPVI